MHVDKNQSSIGLLIDVWLTKTDFLVHMNAQQLLLFTSLCIYIDLFINIDSLWV